MLCWLTGKAVDEVAKTVSMFMSIHGSWMVDQLQRIAHYFHYKFVSSFVVFALIIIAVLYL